MPIESHKDCRRASAIINDDLLVEVHDLVRNDFLKWLKKCKLFLTHVWPFEPKIWG
jgi:hypothetical protein